jgi:hypothetical protein
MRFSRTGLLINDYKLVPARSRESRFASRFMLVAGPKANEIARYAGLAAALVLIYIHVAHAHVRAGPTYLSTYQFSWYLPDV